MNLSESNLDLLHHSSPPLTDSLLVDEMSHKYSDDGAHQVT